MPQTWHGVAHLRDGMPCPGDGQARAIHVMWADAAICAVIEPEVTVKTSVASTRPTEALLPPGAVVPGSAARQRMAVPLACLWPVPTGDPAAFFVAKSSAGPDHALPVFVTDGVPRRAAAGVESLAATGITPVWRVTR